MNGFLTGLVIVAGVLQVLLQAQAQVLIPGQCADNQVVQNFSIPSVR